MESYRKVDAAVYVARRRFDIVTAAASRDHSTTVAQVARQHHCSRAQVYVLTRRVLDALAPGPRHHAAFTTSSPLHLDPGRSVTSIASHSARCAIHSFW